MNRIVSLLITSREPPYKTDLNSFFGQDDVATDVLSSFPRYIKKVYEGTQDP